MSIDLETEKPISLRQGCRLVPSSHATRSEIHFSTILRWVLEGVKDPNGNMVRLEAVRIGGRWITSREALARFAERLTPRVGEDTEPAPVPRSPDKRRRASEVAAKQLAKIGI